MEPGASPSGGMVQAGRHHEASATARERARASQWRALGLARLKLQSWLRYQLSLESQILETHRNVLKNLQ